MPQVNLKKQAWKKDQAPIELRHYYEQRLFDARAELIEKSNRKSARIALLETELREKDVTIAETTAVAVRRSARIVALKKDIADKDAEIARLKREVSDLQFRLLFSRRKPTCSSCGEIGHNRTTCTR
jgi:chromosome segregation ATPase